MTHPKVDLHGTSSTPEDSMLFSMEQPSMEQITREDFHNIKHGEERWMEDHFPFLSLVICRFLAVNLPKNCTRLSFSDSEVEVSGTCHLERQMENDEFQVGYGWMYIDVYR